MKRIAVAIAVLLIAASPLAQSSPPTFELPAPTGRLPIGTTRWVVADSSRDELFAPGRKRDIGLIAWYPSSSAAGQPAPYLRDGMEEVLSLARLAKLGDAFYGLAGVKTHATLDALPATMPARFPVILFQHGYTGLPSSHTALIEDLASHGWAVLNLIHPYEATGTRLADGTVVTFTDEKNAMRAGVMDVLNEWGPEGGTMEKIVAATDEAEQERLMRGYLSGLKNTDRVVKRWTLDATYALNLDGIPQYGTMIDTPMPAPFLMVYSGRAGRAGASDIIYRRSASKYYRVDVKDTLHLDFTDMNYWGGPLRQRGAYGKIEPVRAAELTRMIVREFFAQEILKQPSAFLSGKQLLSDVTVTSYANCKSGEKVKQVHFVRIET